MAITEHLTDDDITTDWRDRSVRATASEAGPTEADDDRDQGGEGDADTGDEVTGQDAPAGGNADTTDS